MLNFLLDFLFPKSCLNCGQSGEYLCQDCFGKIEYWDRQQNLTELDSLYVLAHYKGPIREAIRKIKYEGIFDATNFLAEIFLKKYDGPKFDILIPVPLHPVKWKLRGFNQSEIMAKKINLGKVSNLLERTRETKPQFDLKVLERYDNVKDAFSLNENCLPGRQAGKLKIENLSVCLVDDVITTGSTLIECAKALRLAGASKINAICLARGN